MPAADTPTTTIEHDDRLLTVKELAGRLGRRPRWVYANADALGAIRVGEGNHPQLPFQRGRTPPAYGAGRHDLGAVTREHGLEGIVAKRVSAPYLI